jgi:hypothetical protein
MTIKTCKRKKLKNNKYYTYNSKCNLQTKIKQNIRGSLSFNKKKLIEDKNLKHIMCGGEIKDIIIAVEFFKDNYKNIIKNADFRSKLIKTTFPSDEVIDILKIANEFSIEYIFLKTCHVLALSFIQFMKDKNFISNVSLEFINNKDNIDDYSQIKNFINKPYTIGRFLIKNNTYRSLHEFIILNLNVSKYILQVNIWDKNIHELLLINFNEDISELFKNNLNLFFKLKLIDEDVYKNITPEYKDRYTPKLIVYAFFGYDIDKTTMF